MSFLHATDKPPELIKLLVSDIDGTLVTDKKEITSQTQSAAHALEEAGITLCLVSSRPPSGMRQFATALHNQNPFAGYNGALIVSPSNKVLSHLVMKTEDVHRIVEMLEDNNIQVWIFKGNEWYASDWGNAFQKEEEETILLTPLKIQKWDESHYEGVEKMMAVSADTKRLSEMEKELQTLYSERVSIAHSMPQYIDITDISANKGYAARTLAALMDVPMEHVACIGDMNNDIPMMEAVGCAIAMGNATDKVKSHARHVTSSNGEEGWAKAVRKYILRSTPS